MTATRHQVPSLAKGISVSWLIAPALIMWQATTWTPIDLWLVFAAGVPALWLLFARRERPVLVTQGAPFAVLAAGVGSIGFDFIVPRLAAIDPGIARTVHIVGFLVLAAMSIIIRRGAFRTGLAMLLLVALALGAWCIIEVGEPGIDVWRAHDEASRLLASGGNPYAELNLTLEPGSSEGRLRQYFYPPLTLAWYAGWTLLLGDPRWASLVAWLIMLAIGCFAAVRSRNPALGSAILAFVAVQPGWFLLLTGSFTEPLTAMLAAAAAIALVRHPDVAAVMLGLAMASKQHVLLAGPIVVLGWARIDRRRSVFAALTAAFALSIGLAFGPTEYWSATLAGPTLATPNPNSVTLFALLKRFGYDLVLPSVVPVLAAVSVGLSLVRRVPGAGWPSLQMAAVIGTFLFLVSFAIWSHWVMVTLLVTIGVFCICVRSKPGTTLWDRHDLT